MTTENRIVTFAGGVSHVLTSVFSRPSEFERRRGSRLVVGKIEEESLKARGKLKMSA